MSKYLDAGFRRARIFGHCTLQCLGRLFIPRILMYEFNQFISTERFFAFVN